MNCACVENPPAGPIAWPWFCVKPFQRGIEILFSPALECQWIGAPRSWHVAHSGSHHVSLKCLSPGRVVLGSASITTPRWPFFTARCDFLRRHFDAAQVGNDAERHVAIAQLAPFGEPVVVGLHARELELRVALKDRAALYRIVREQHFAVDHAARRRGGVRAGDFPDESVDGAGGVLAYSGASVAQGKPARVSGSAHPAHHFGVSRRGWRHDGARSSSDADRCPGQNAIVDSRPGGSGVIAVETRRAIGA